MKKLFILLLLAISATANAVEVLENDTLTILKPKKVRIITGDSIQKIKVYGREGEDKYTYESKILLVDSNYVSEESINKDTWTFDFIKSKSHGTGYPLKQRNLSSRLGFGLCYGANADYKGPQSVGSSWEIMWTIAEIEKYGYGKHNGFSIGFGVNWRNFRIDGRSKFVKLDDGTITEEALPAGYDNDFSRTWSCVQHQYLCQNQEPLLGCRWREAQANIQEDSPAPHHSRYYGRGKFPQLVQHLWQVLAYDHPQLYLCQ